MIPKIIHWIWFSEELPSEILQHVTEWKKFNPDYEIRHWGYDEIRNVHSSFMDEALKLKKWAFATDFLRLYVLYHFGGIYLDSDVKLLRNLNSFLSHQCFMGKEQTIHIEDGKQEQYLTAHCIGAVKGHPFIKKCLDYYEELHFRLSSNEDLPISLKYNMTLLPYNLSELAKQIGYDPKPLSQVVQKLDNLTIFPSHYFDATPKKADSVAIHFANGSWRQYSYYEPHYNLKYKIGWRLANLCKKILAPYKYIIIKLK